MSVYGDSTFRRNRDGILCCGGVPIPNVIRLAGQMTDEPTPTYVYSETRLQENCRAVRAAFPSARIMFAVKANMNSSLLERMRRTCIDGFDVVNDGEARQGLLTGAGGANITYAGSAKTDKEIDFAVRNGSLIAVESPGELPIIEDAAGRHGTRPQLMLRLRPNVDAHTHRHLTTGVAFSKFGMPRDQVIDILEDWRGADRLPQIVGLHFHIGSQIDAPECTQQALEVALPIIDKYQLGKLDIGGGFPVAYKPRQKVPPLDAFSEVVYGTIGDRQLELIIEPGRRIVADAGILVVSAMCSEHNLFNGGKPASIVRCDGGMADLIRPMLYDAYHHIIPVMRSVEINPVDTYFAGPYCESTDWLGKKRRGMPYFNRHDLIAVMTAGAYGYSMASNYNCNHKPAELMVTADGSIIVISIREPFSHVVGMQTAA